MAPPASYRPSLKFRASRAGGLYFARKRRRGRLPAPTEAADRAPAILTAPMITSTGFDLGDTLMVSAPGTYQDGHPAGFTVEGSWFSDEVEVGLGPTYDIMATDAGAALTWREQATGPGGVSLTNVSNVITAAEAP